MTLHEAVKRGIPKLRREPWGPDGRITLLLTDGGVGPWVTVEDAGTDGGALDPQKVLIHQLDMDSDVWEEWKGGRNGSD